MLPQVPFIDAFEDDTIQVIYKTDHFTHTMSNANSFLKKLKSLHINPIYIGLATAFGASFGFDMYDLWLKNRKIKALEKLGDRFKNE